MSECNHVFTIDSTCDVCGYGSVYLLEKAQERIQQLKKWRQNDCRIIDAQRQRIQQLTDELKWLQDNHVRVCSRESKLDLRIQQLTDGINRAGAYLSQGEPNIARETLAALLTKEKT